MPSNLASSVLYHHYPQDAHDACLEAALLPKVALHGVLCTLNFAGPVIIVNGPITKAIGMNWGGNCFGQGNRDNATIGRSLQLIVRNVGGAPGRNTLDLINRTYLFPFQLTYQ